MRAMTRVTTSLVALALLCTSLWASADTQHSKLWASADTQYFKEDHLKGALYIALMPDGTYAVIDREQGSVSVEENGRWTRSAEQITFVPSDRKKAPYSAQEVNYRDCVFLAWQTGTTPWIVISKSDIERELDSSPKTPPSFVFVRVGAATYQREAKETYPSAPFEEDLKAVTASGKVENNVYSNSYAGFQLALPEPPCTPNLNTTVNVGRGYAILLSCAHVVKGWQGMYTLTIALDYRANYPYLQDMNQYVRSLRHAVERDPNQKTVQIEQPIHMAGLDFVQALLSEQIPEGTYYQGITCTQLKAYLLCFEAEASSVAAVRGVLDLDRKLELTGRAKTSIQ